MRGLLGERRLICVTGGGWLRQDPSRRHRRPAACRGVRRGVLRRPLGVPRRGCGRRRRRGGRRRACRVRRRSRRRHRRHVRGAPLPDRDRQLRARDRGGRRARRRPHQRLGDPRRARHQSRAARRRRRSRRAPRAPGAARPSATSAEITTCASVALFVDRARLASATFEPDWRARRDRSDLPSSRRVAAGDRARRGARRSALDRRHRAAGSTGGSSCSPAGPAPLWLGTDRCGPASTGRSNCSARTSGPCSIACRSSPAPGRWLRRGRSSPTPASTPTRWRTACSRSSTARW